MYVERIGLGQAARQAAGFGAVLLIVLLALIEQRLRPRRPRHFDPVQIIVLTAGVHVLPEAGQIGLPVRRPGRRRGQVGFAARRARDSGSRVVHPLRRGRHAKHGAKREHDAKAHRNYVTGFGVA